jgi:hypothetical protein
MLTEGGIQLLHSFQSDSDPIPLKLQVLEVRNNMSTNPERIDIVVSDGCHYCTLTLAQQMHSLVSSNKLHHCSLVVLEKYITQSVMPNKFATICLSVSVVAQNLAIIGTPTEFVPTYSPSSESASFVGILSDDECTYCTQQPCEWVQFGPTIVAAVQGLRDSSQAGIGCSNNKSFRHAAYSMFVRTKYGYLGKGNQVPLPTCVVDGIRENFPDPTNTYVGFSATENE